MKRILLSSAAIVAFAGAAAADGHASVSFSGDAEIGYNDDVRNGIFWSLGLGVSGTAALDNGITASISGDIELNNHVLANPYADDDGDGFANADADSDGTITAAELATFNNANTSAFDGNVVTIDDLVIKLASDSASLTFGDTAPAADKMWSGVTNMDNDGFNDEGDNGEDAVLIGEMSFGDINVGLSYSINSSNGGADDDVSDLQVGVTGNLGSMSFALAYQDDDHAAGEIMGLSVGMSLGGADVKLAYADAGGDTSTGIQVTYPVGDVSVTAFYVMQDPQDDNYGIAVSYASGPLSIDARFHDGNDEEMAIEGSYDLGNGIVIKAGWVDDTDNNADSTVYVGTTIDLGGGASLLLSYADTEVDGSDEKGAPEYKDGMTVAVSMSF